MERRRAPAGPLALAVTLLVFATLLAFTTADLEPLTEQDLKDAGLICSGTKSRAARLSLEENVYDEVARVGYQLPANCPLARSNDMLLPLEAHKQSRSSDRSRSSSTTSTTTITDHSRAHSFLFSSSLSRLGLHPPFPLHIRPDADEEVEEREGKEAVKGEAEEEEEKGMGATRAHRWKCKLCKRSFSGEEYLDLHLKKKHPEVWDEAAGVCLGDYCDILRCHEYQEKAPIGAASSLGCTPATLEKRKFECKSVMHKCFPPEAGEAAHRLNAQFTRLFCDELSCAPTELKRSKWSKLGNILWWILAAAVVIGLIIFYGVVWLYRRNQRLSGDLRRLSSKRQVSRLQSWGKVKGY